MRKKRRISKGLRRLPLAIVAGATALALHACGRAEAEPQADPRAVQLYLAELEARDAAAQVAADEAKKKGVSKNVRNFVEGAATRAPSDAFINRIEDVVVSKSG